MQHTAFIAATAFLCLSVSAKLQQVRAEESPPVSKSRCRLGVFAMDNGGAPAIDSVSILLDYHFQRTSEGQRDRGLANPPPLFAESTKTCRDLLG